MLGCPQAAAEQGRRGVRVAFEPHLILQTDVGCRRFRTPTRLTALTKRKEKNRRKEKKNKYPDHVPSPPSTTVIFRSRFFLLFRPIHPSIIDLDKATTKKRKRKKKKKSQRRNNYTAMPNLSTVTTRTNTPAMGSPTTATYPPDILDVAVEGVKIAESRVLLIMTGNFFVERPRLFVRPGRC